MHPIIRGSERFMTASHFKPEFIANQQTLATERQAIHSQRDAQLQKDDEAIFAHKPILEQTQNAADALGFTGNPELDALFKNISAFTSSLTAHPTNDSMAGLFETNSLFAEQQKSMAERRAQEQAKLDADLAQLKKAEEQRIQERTVRFNLDNAPNSLIRRNSISDFSRKGMSPLPQE